MNTFFQTYPVLATTLVFFTIDAIASLAVFFAFKRSVRLQNRLRYAIRFFLGLNEESYEIHQTFDALNEKINKEIANRQILRNRVRETRKQLGHTKLALVRTIDVVEEIAYNDDTKGEA